MAWQGICAVGVLAVALAPPALAQAPGPQTSLSDLLRRQTEAFSQASQTGDKAGLARYLDRDVVFTNETGAKVSRQEILDGATPATGPAPRNVVVDWALQPQGEMATATFTDVVTRDVFGHQVETRYRSTETWARRRDGWKMVASDTAYVPHDPPSAAIPAGELEGYVGVYQLAPALRVAITRADGGLASSVNGAAPTPLRFEARDVAFTPGGGDGRRLFLRDASGRIAGYLSSRDGTDLRFDRVG